LLDPLGFWFQFLVPGRRGVEGVGPALAQPRRPSDRGRDPARVVPPCRERLRVTEVLLDVECGT